jgi:hypothetical protein
VKQISTQATNAFAKQFPSAYRDCLLQELKRAHYQQQNMLQQESSEGSVRQSSQSSHSTGPLSSLPPLPIPNNLLTAPPPTKIIKTGELFKKGAINTGWKKRQFTALNRADNYAIEYGEDSGSAAKGRINCYG